MIEQEERVEQIASDLFAGLVMIGFGLVLIDRTVRRARNTRAVEAVEEVPEQESSASVTPIREARISDHDM